KFKQLLFGLFYIIKYFRYWSRNSQVSIKHRILNWPYLIHFYKTLRPMDVFHVQFALGGTGIAEMKDIGLLKTKLITTFHGHDAHYKNKNVLSKLQSSYRILFKTSNYITVNTPYLGNQVLMLGCNEQKLKVIPMAIDVAYFK